MRGEVPKKVSVRAVRALDGFLLPPPGRVFLQDHPLVRELRTAPDRQEFGRAPHSVTSVACPSLDDVVLHHGQVLRPLTRGRSSRRAACAAVGVLAVVLASACSASAQVAVQQSPPSVTTGAAGATRVGWSNRDIQGLDQRIIGTWMARDSWADLEQGHWLADNPDYQRYVRAHPGGTADVGVPLVPHDSPRPVSDLLAEAVSGARDQTYRDLGRALARSGPATVYARVWWEMNMQPGAGRIDRVAFRKAWQHVVPLVRQGFTAAARPGQQLSVVFCPTADGADWQSFYPGDGVVDVVGVDAYGQRWGSRTPSAQELLGLVGSQLDRVARFASDHDKRLALPEWGNVSRQPGRKDQQQGRGDFPEYIDLVFDWAARHHALYLVYFNSKEGGINQTLSQTPRSLARLDARTTALAARG